MDVQDAIKKLLADNAGVSELAGARIYPVVLPQKTCTYPAIAYRSVGEDRVVALDGGVGLRTTRFRIFSVTTIGTGHYAGARALAEKVRLALQDYAGVVSDGESPESTIQIQTIEALNAVDLYDDATQTYQVAADFEVVAEEAIP